MIEKNSENKMVGALLDAASDDAPLPNNDLMTRVLADAVTTQAGFEPMRDAKPTPRIWHDLFRFLGGWPAMAGLATATFAGVWLGTFPPEFLPDATDAYLGLDDAAYLIDTDIGLGFDLAEEAL